MAFRVFFNGGLQRWFLGFATNRRKLTENTLIGAFSVGKLEPDVQINNELPCTCNISSGIVLMNF